LGVELVGGVTVVVELVEVGVVLEDDTTVELLETADMVDD
jgi:hypothetical protein